MSDRADAANRWLQLARELRCAAAGKAAIGWARSEFHNPYDRVADFVAIGKWGIIHDTRKPTLEYRVKDAAQN